MRVEVQVKVRGQWVAAGEGISRSALTRHVDVCFGRLARRRFVTLGAADMV